MKITEKRLRSIIREEIDMQEIPTPDEIKEWWEYTDPGSLNMILKKTGACHMNPLMWNADDWEKITDYYVQVEMGDSRGYQRGRNI